MGSEGHQDIDLAILTALLKGGLMNKCINACVHDHECVVEQSLCRVFCQMYLHKKQELEVFFSLKESNVFSFRPRPLTKKDIFFNLMFQKRYINTHCLCESMFSFERSDAASGSMQS